MDSSDSAERRAKRTKYAQHQPDDQYHAQRHRESASTSPIATTPNSNFSDGSNGTSSSKPWHLWSLSPSPSPPAFTPPTFQLPPPELVDTHNPALVTSMPLSSAAFLTAPSDVGHTQLPPLSYQNHSAPQPRLPRLIVPASDDSRGSSPPELHDHRRRKVRTRTSFSSPFRDRLDSFSISPTPRYSRPPSGQVNGYVKFNWMGEVLGGAPAASHPAPTLQPARLMPPERDLVSTAQPPALMIATAASLLASSAPKPAIILEDDSPSPPSVDSPIIISPASSTRSSPSRALSRAPSDLGQLSGPLCGQLIPQNQPRLLPPQFGLNTKMDMIDRKFWDFYINNWCPGRSILKMTNLWHQDFARMHSVDGILAGLQSLAGVYIYDYLPLESIQKRVSDRFALAENRLVTIMQDPEKVKNDARVSDELITILVILSMQDVILTESRLKRPFSPRWLDGFKHSEYLLQQTDQGVRFWLQSNVQLSSLRSSHYVIVGRALILAQPLVPLPASHQFDAEREAARFGWLLHGTRAETYEIHGGCGFSRKLLHILSQITFCTARLQQERESPVVPVMADFLYNELVQMRQWSPEISRWEMVKDGPSTLSVLMNVSSPSVVHTPVGVTTVTAEAWRIAAMIYLQCRLLRLPRNHPLVLSNLEDLSRCIKAMPTSGDHFTAQAPLFPVFLLGLLATVKKHKDIAETWFSGVIKTPVRSSVPPLFESLKRIWTWIDSEVELPRPNGPNFPPAIRNRRPWWERLVSRIQEKEEEVLCLT